MPRLVADRLLREIEGIIFGIGDWQDSPLLRTQNQQQLLARFFPACSLRAFQPNPPHPARGTPSQDTQFLAARQTLFNLFRLIVLQQICKLKAEDLRTGAIIVAYRCELDHPFEDFVRERDDASLAKSSDEELSRFLTDLCQIVKRKVNPVLPKELQLTFPDPERITHPKYVPSILGGFRTAFMDTLRPIFTHAREELGGSIFPLETTIEHESTAAIPDDEEESLGRELYENLRNDLASYYSGLLPPAYERSWAERFGTSFDRDGNVQYPYHQVFGRVKPFSPWPSTLFIPPSLQTVDLDSSGLLSHSDSISIEEFLIGEPCRRTLLLGGIGSGRTTFARKLGETLCLNAETQSPILMLYIDCSSNHAELVKQSPYQIAAQRLVSQFDFADLPVGQLEFLLESWTRVGRIIWVFDHIFEEVDGTPPVYLSAWAPFLPRDTRLILIPESTNRSFLLKLMSLFAPVQSVLALQPVSDDQILTFQHSYFDETLRGYQHPETQEYSLALEQSTQEEIEKRKGILGNKDFCRFLTAQEQTERKHGREIIERIFQHPHLPVLPVRTPLAIAAYCMAQEISSYPELIPFLLLLYCEQAGIPCQDLHYPPFRRNMEEALRPDFSVLESLRLLAWELIKAGEKEKAERIHFTQQEFRGWMEPLHPMDANRLLHGILRTRVVERSYRNADQFRFSLPGFQTLLAGSVYLDRNLGDMARHYFSPERAAHKENPLYQTAHGLLDPSRL